MLKLFGMILALGAALATVTCSKAYYSVWEAVGKDKRDLLHDQVENVRDEQSATKKQFEDALTRMRKLYGTGGGDLEKMYDTLKADYENSKRHAEDLKDRIGRVDKIGKDLFNEWDAEIDEISDSKMKRDSRKKLVATQQRFDGMLQAMHKAEQSTGPVLVKFRDQVLYLKHNLNAQAIGNLRGEAADIERSVKNLMQEMNRSIAAADAFIKTLPQEN